MAERDEGTATREIASLSRNFRLGGSFREPDMMALDHRLTPSSGYLGGQGWREGGGTADKPPRTE